MVTVDAATMYGIEMIETTLDPAGTLMYLQWFYSLSLSRVETSCS